MFTRFLLRSVRVAVLSFVEARPAVQGAFMLRFAAGYSFSGGASLLALAWAAAWLCATWAIYLLNGVTDVVEDRVNASSRPVARGLLGPREATATVGVLVALGLAITLATGHPTWWTLPLLLGLGWAYSAPPLSLKRWPLGLVAVATPAALLTYHAGFVAGGGRGLADEPALLAFSAIMALWMTIVGQAKDLSDVEGDRRAGRRSLPVVLGDGPAKLLVSTAALLLALTSVVTAGLLGPELLAPASCLILGGLTLAVITLGPWSKEGKDRRKPYDVFMITQYAANLAVTLI